MNTYSLQEFDKTIPEYQLALEKSRYREKLTGCKTCSVKILLIMLLTHTRLNCKIFFICSFLP